MGHTTRLSITHGIDIVYISPLSTYRKQHLTNSHPLMGTNLEGSPQSLSRWRFWLESQPLRRRRPQGVDVSSPIPSLRLSRASKSIPGCCTRLSSAFVIDASRRSNTLSRWPCSCSMPPPRGATSSLRPLPAKNTWPYGEGKYNLPVMPGLTKDTLTYRMPLLDLRTLASSLPAKHAWPYGAGNTMMCQ